MPNSHKLCHALSKKRNRQLGKSLSSDDKFQLDNTKECSDRITPELQLLSEELGQEIQHVLSDMPAEFRTTLLLNTYDGLSYQSISDVMQVPIGTVRSRIHRGREIMAKSLKAEIE